MTIIPSIPSIPAAALASLSLTTLTSYPGTFAPYSHKKLCKFKKFPLFKYLIGFYCALFMFTLV